MSADALRAVAVELERHGPRLDSATPRLATWWLMFSLRVLLGVAAGWLVATWLDRDLPDVGSAAMFGTLAGVAAFAGLQQLALAAADRRAARFMDRFADRLLDWAQDAPLAVASDLHAHELRDFVAFMHEGRLQLLPAQLEGTHEALIIRGTLGRRLVLPWRLPDIRVEEEDGVQVAIVRLEGLRPFAFFTGWREALSGFRTPTPATAEDAAAAARFAELAKRRPGRASRRRRRFGC